MASCLYCGQSIEGKRKGTKFCCASHRTLYGRKERRKIEAAALIAEQERLEAERIAEQQRIESAARLVRFQAWTKSVLGRGKLADVRHYLPVTAKHLEKYGEVNGDDCLEPIIELVLSAVREVEAMKSGA